MTAGTRPIYDVVCHRSARWFAAVVLALSFLLPTAGLGVDLCWFAAATDLPCPGCGLTRSLTNLSHGHPLVAVRYHPFGPLFWLWAWALVGLLLSGARGDARARALFSRHERSLRLAYGGFILSFLTFGALRLAVAALVPGAVPLP